MRSRVNQLVLEDDGEIVGRSIFESLIKDVFGGSKNLDSILGNLGKRSRYCMQLAEIDRKTMQRQFTEVFERLLRTDPEEIFANPTIQRLAMQLALGKGIIDILNKIEDEEEYVAGSGEEDATATMRRETAIK